MRWFLYLPLNQLANWIAWLLSPLFAIFADDAGNYPWLLRWAATPDNPADGDAPFQMYHAPFPGARGGIKRWWNRATWMRRNPAYGADFALGFRANGETPRRVFGTHSISGELAEDGWFFARCGYAWELWISHHWTLNHCTKINLGWKLWGDDPHQLVFSPLGIWKVIS